MAKSSPQTDRVMAFIVAEVERCGVFPCSTAIMQHMGWTYPSGVEDTLLRLACRGDLVRTPIPSRYGSRKKYKYALLDKVRSEDPHV